MAHGIRLQAAFRAGLCIESTSSRMDTGVSSYLFDSACFFSDSAGRESPGGDSLCFCFARRQKKVSKVHAVGVRSLRKAKLCEHQKATRSLGPYAALRAYLKDVLIRLPTHLNSRIDELLPHRWQPVG
jgi:hypothetical protein